MKRMRYTVIAGCVVVGLLSGCVTKTSTLQMTAKKDILDKSAIAVDANEKFTTVLILPPGGVVDANPYDKVIDRFTREFIRQGVKVLATTKSITAGEDLNTDSVSGFIKGVEDDSLPFDVIFQIGEFVWDKEVSNTRFFSLNTPGSPFTEVTQTYQDNYAAYIVAFASPVLYAKGRFINVKSGECIASIDMTLPLNFTLPCNYVAKYVFTRNLNTGYVMASGVPSTENFPYGKTDWHARATQETEDRMVSAIVSRLLQK